MKRQYNKGGGVIGQSPGAGMGLGAGGGGARTIGGGSGIFTAHADRS